MVATIGVARFSIPPTEAWMCLSSVYSKIEGIAVPTRANPSIRSNRVPSRLNATPLQPHNELRISKLR